MQSFAINDDRRMARRLMNSEFERIWKEASRISLRYFSVVSEGTVENLQSGKGTQFSCPDHSCRFPEYDFEGHVADREFRFVIRHN
jgi:hypothetical protein